MSEKISNPILAKILTDLDSLVKAEEVTTVRVLQREINVAIKKAEEVFKQSFSLPGRATKTKES